MRKVPLVLAALVAVFFWTALPSNLEARSSHRSQSKTVKRHKARSQKSRHSAASRRSHRLRPVITQDASGRVILDRFPVPPMYGPFFPGHLHNYPQPDCETMDVVVEARLHEVEAGADEEGEIPKTAQASLPAVGREPASLTRIAEKLGAFFRPKSSAAVVKPQDVDLTELLSQGFQIPVEGVDAEKLRDSFLSSRGRHRQHLAIDIGAPRGTPVLATTDGEIVRVSRERRAGRAIYQRDSSGQYLLFYCHLSRYEEGLAAGRNVRKGEVIGYVGSSGHVVGGSHLHFSITRLPGDDGSFKRGLAINPYLLFLAGVP